MGDRHFKTDFPGKGRPPLPRLNPTWTEMRQQTKRRRPKSRRWQSPKWTVMKNKAWILAGILVLAATIFGMVGRKVVEFDRYLDQQLE